MPESAEGISGTEVTGEQMVELDPHRELLARDSAKRFEYLLDDDGCPPQSEGQPVIRRRNPPSLLRQGKNVFEDEREVSVSDLDPHDGIGR